MNVIMEHASLAVVTLDWPETRNSITPQRADDLARVLTELPSDTRGVVLTGNGAFCAGGDLRFLIDALEGTDDDLRTSIYRSYQGLIRALLGVRVPTVAAIDGPAIGLGMDLALGCDVRIVSTAGYLHQGWSRAGLIPGTGGVLLLQRFLNQQQLWRLLGNPGPLRGDRLRELGLAEPVADESSVPAALEFLTHFDAWPRAALEAYVQLSRAPLRTQLDMHLATCVELQIGLLRGDRFLDFAKRYKQSEER